MSTFKQSLIQQNLRLAKASFETAEASSGVRRLSALYGGSQQAIAAYSCYLQDLLSSLSLAPKTATFQEANLASLDRALRTALAKERHPLLQRELALFDGSGGSDQTGELGQTGGAPLSLFSDVEASLNTTFSDWQKKQPAASDQPALIVSSARAPAHWTKVPIEAYLSAFAQLELHLKEQLGLSREF